LWIQRDHWAKTEKPESPKTGISTARPKRVVRPVSAMMMKRAAVTQWRIRSQSAHRFR
jgi:hypothetical protein